jgi:flagellar basal body-associated protein FliL
MKKIGIKLLLLFILFVASIGIYFVVTLDRSEGEEETMQTASLPIVSMLYDNNVVNTLHGYTVAMDAKYMRDSITPLEVDRKLSVSINIYDNVVASISYELRSLDTTQLIEKNNVTEYTVEGSNVLTTLNLSNIIESDTEYLLILKVVTEKHGEINYYTRVIDQEAADVLSHIKFITGFSEGTLNDETAKEYMAYLEPKSSADNSNLAKVDLNSSFTNVTWGDLDVSRVSEPIVKIKEILGDVGCYELCYKVKAKGAGDVVLYYNVTEYFRVKQGVNVMYLYVYERSMEQIFDCDNINVSSTRINLGLDSDLKVETSCSPTGSFVSFVKERNLWLMDMNNNKMISIISYESGQDSDIRDVFNENNIEIVSTNAKGNVLFLVYGYMNKGEHEGKVGTALYQYEYESNVVNELVFVASDKPYEILKGQVGKFAYITKDNIIYLMVEDSIYTITTDSNEYVQLANHLQTGNFIINDDNNIVVWHENSSIYGAESLRVIDAASGGDYNIACDSADYIRAIGFIGNDMVYGFARRSDVYVDEYGNTVFPMYKIVVDIYDSDEVVEYNKDNVYVSDVTINGNMIMLERMTKDEAGLFQEMSSDQLINKVDEDVATIEQYTIATDLKKTELVLKFAYTVTSNNALAKVYPKEINFVAVNDIGKTDDKLEDNNYYVYADGGLILTTSSVTKAINKASKEYGVVVNGSGNYVWARLSKLDNKVVASATQVASPNYSSISQVLENDTIKTLDISSISLLDVLYYTTKDIAVLANLPERGIVAISGYSGYLGNVDTVYFRTYDGESFNMTISEAEKESNEAGGRYVAVFND